MSKSTYKKWMTEAFINEADDDAGKHEDGDTWTTASGKYAGKHKGEVDYFEDKEDASDYAKHGASGMPDDDKEKKTPVSIDIDAAGGLGGDDEEKPKSKEIERDDDGVPENEQDWAEEIDQVQSDYEEMKDNYEQSRQDGAPDDPEEKEQMDLDRVEYRKAEDKLRKYKKKEKEQGWDREMGRTGRELSGEVTINGKQYRPIKESVSPTAIHPFKKTYKKIGGK